MKHPAQRRDYRANLRRKTPHGCTWCGGPVDPPVTTASYCSDACLEADVQGIDDLPPVMLLQPGNGSNSAYIERKFSEYNRDFG